jgi:CheY-like chemotaxis protein
VAITRLLFLRDLGYEVTSGFGNEAAKEILPNLRLRSALFIVGHTTSIEIRSDMVAELKANYPGVPILALNPPKQSVLASGDYNVRLDGQDAWFSKIAILRLSSRRPKEPFIRIETVCSMSAGQFNASYSTQRIVFLPESLLNLFIALPSGVLAARPNVHMTKRVLIADDSSLMRRSVRGVLESQSDIEVCGEAQDGLDAITKASELNPDLIILDMSMPRMHGLEAGHILKEMMPAVPLVLFTAHRDVLRESDVIRAGVSAIVSKTEGADVLVKAVRNLCRARST